MPEDNRLSGFLAEAFDESRRRLSVWREQRLLGTLRFRDIPPRSNLDFATSLRRGNSIRLIAEFKRSSPSAGPLCSNADIASRVQAYVAGGAAAVSVLTESKWFGGSLEDLFAARGAVQVPILRKDFIVDEYDLELSAAAGADAVLLIAAAFDPTRLGELLTCCRQLELSALVETHDSLDAQTACEAGAEIIGVNCRDLQSLKVDMEMAVQVLRDLPIDRVRVLESGIQSPADLQAAYDAGADAVLVGEMLMRATDPVRKIRELLNVSEPRTSVRADVRTLHTTLDP